jgi:Skp family chaperone for outer membrane proteins
MLKSTSDPEIIIQSL